MEKKTEGYLHFYLGCEFKFKLTNGNYSAKMFIDEYLLMAVKAEKAKDDPMKPLPLLSSLSDITEEDAKVWLETYHNAVTITIGKISTTGVWYGFLGLKKERFMNFEYFKHSWPEGFVYLLSKGYDLFGLIESGLAIDKKTLK